MKAQLTMPAFLVASMIVATLFIAVNTGCDSKQPAKKEPVDSDVAAKDNKDNVDNPPTSDESNATTDETSPKDDAPTSDATPTTDNAKDDPPPKPGDSSVKTTDPPVEPANGKSNGEAVTLPFELDDKGNPIIKPGDWSQWAGTSYRNNVPEATGIPSDFTPGKFDRKTREWKGAKNIKWVSQLGSQTYGNPVIADGRVFVGTNNSGGYLKRYPGVVDLGCMLAFRESDGKFLWQHSSEKLPTGRVHDWEMQGICSTMYVEGNRGWFVSSRGHVVCVDTEGYYDGEDDGPVKGEWARLFNVSTPQDPDVEDPLAPAMAAVKDGKLNDYLRAQLARVDMPVPDDVMVKTNMEKPNNWSFTAKVNDKDRQFYLRKEGPRLAVYKVVTPDDKTEADVIWSYNMMTELGSSQHNMCSCSLTALGDVLFVCTSNGVDESHENIPAPDAPSFFAMDKNTAEVYWTDKSPATNILHGQWSSPTVAVIGGVPQAIFAGGDGWVYSFRADKGKDGKPELLWKFDANPKESEWLLAGRGTRNNIIATPVVYDNMVYVAVGQDPEDGEGDGHLWCIDPTKRGDVSPQLAMKIEGDKRVPIPHRRLKAVDAEAGEVAVDNSNSAAIWHYSKKDWNGDGKIKFEETMHRSCGTVAIKDDILYISDFSGLIHCLDAKTGERHFVYDMFAQAWGSPLIVDGKVYIGDEDGDVAIFNLSADEPDPIAEINMGSSVYSTPVVANGVMYISSKSYLFAIAAEEAAAGGGD